jgi:glucan phosphoethanolaminetransferase (alkaline phosphatase superfamily)
MAALIFRLVTRLAFFTFLWLTLCGSCAAITYGAVWHGTVERLFHHQEYLALVLSAFGCLWWVWFVAHRAAELTVWCEAEVTRFQHALIRRGARKRLDKMLATPIRNDVDAAKAFGYDLAEPFDLSSKREVH